MQLEGRDRHTPLSSDEFEEIMHTINLDGANHIAVAVSGGGDSMALAFLLSRWCKKEKITLTALTIDHGLRDTSEKEALKVAGWLKNMDVEHRILSWKGEKPKSNIQDSARTARYNLLGEWCHANQVKDIFLAHHEDDQAETFLIRLARGSGVDGLSAMGTTTEVDISSGDISLRLHRPLLDIPKERLIAILNDQQMKWIEDPSNEDDRYFRVQVRKFVKNNNIEGLNVGRLSSTAKRMRRVRSLLEELTHSAESKYVLYNPLGFALLKQDFFKELHDEISLRLLSLILKKVSGNRYPPRHRKLEKLFHGIKENQFSTQTLSGTILFLTKDGNFVIAREAKGIAKETRVVDQKQLIWDNRFFVDVGDTEGCIRPIDNLCLNIVEEYHPGFKDHIGSLFDNAYFRDKILFSLPCMVVTEKDIRLPEILIRQTELKNVALFSAVFKN